MVSAEWKRVKGKMPQPRLKQNWVNLEGGKNRERKKKWKKKKNRKEMTKKTVISECPWVYFEA